MKYLLLILISSALSAIEIPFKIGERLNYQASFSGLDIAKGSLIVIGEELVNDVSTFHFRFQAKSQGIANYIFPIFDEIDFWLDKNTLYPVRVTKNINEGKYHKKSELLLFQDDRIAILNQDTISINNGIQSPYSLFYFLRSQDLLNLNGESISIIDGNEKIELVMDVKKNLQINVPAGTFLCTKITPTRLNKLKTKNEEAMTIWFSNDKKKYPVQIWLRMKSGGKFILKLNEIIN
jgi:hypothetical protein